MREHGALNRLLLIYEEIAARVTRTQPLPVEPLATSAGIVRRFVEDYHEKLEETELFPRFQKAGVLVDLTQVLKAQHDVGRRLTDEILSLARPDADGGRLTRAIAAFVRMYRPHEAREDTVLFPALHRIVGEKEMDDLGEKFEDREHELFGKDGFDGIVAQIATIEQALDIYNLSGFTPS
jgi:hemerythrin-like domain-containing protein